MRNADEIEVHSRTVDNATILSPQGEIDLSRSPSLRTCLIDAVSRKPQRLVVDLSAVPYMDSSGVATLLEAMQASRRGGGRLVLCGLQDRVKSILEIARLDTVFTIVKTADDGLQA